MVVYNSGLACIRQAVRACVHETVWMAPAADAALVLPDMQVGVMCWLCTAQDSVSYAKFNPVMAWPVQCVHVQLCTAWMLMEWQDALLCVLLGLHHTGNWILGLEWMLYVCTNNSRIAPLYCMRHVVWQVHAVDVLSLYVYTAIWSRSCSGAVGAPDVSCYLLRGFAKCVLTIVDRLAGRQGCTGMCRLESVKKTVEDLSLGRAE